ncbi:Fe-S cluster assembly protein SufD [Mongoliibacter ruber]|uniref:Fe-S cluster assembly protein SufD n=1 Tax=Mongoliibacter ruber TaxID=1750599 RepID=A0A2T0WMV4_9BACT|nr:Fe-S cluster assembly protein SufD [Mongoliibacter ruber]PRY88029.1 Fe-S cluster assembly protein SufD [Mongoliibacter ruber]
MATAIITDILETLLKSSNTTSFPAIREKAKTLALEKGLPEIKEEEYKFTAIQRKLEKSITDFSTAKNISLTTAHIQDALPEGYEGDFLVFNNGRVDLELSKLSKQGYEATLLSSSASDLFGTIAKNEKDVFTAINTSGFEDGIHIQVKKNQKVEKPIHLLFFNQTNEGQVIPTRVLIEIEENAEASFLENSISLDETPYFFNQVVEVKAAQNSKSHYAKLQNESRQAVSVSNFETNIYRDAVFSHTVISLNGDMVRNNLSLNLLDSGVEGNMYGLYLLNGKTHVDNHTNVDHTKPNSDSNELYKGILADSSRGVFNGKIFVRQDAQKTNAFQQNNNILLSEDATINTKPQLEIWADDVKCSHGCTTGQLDEEALFYLQARGIAKDQAKGLLLFAFAGEILEHISDEPFKNHITNLVKERLGSNI